MHNWIFQLSSFQIVITVFWLEAQSSPMLLQRSQGPTRNMASTFKARIGCNIISGVCYMRWGILTEDMGASSILKNKKKSSLAIDDVLKKTPPWRICYIGWMIWVPWRVSGLPNNAMSPSGGQMRLSTPCSWSQHCLVKRNFGQPTFAFAPVFRTAAKNWIECTY